MAKIVLNIAVFILIIVIAYFVFVYGFNIDSSVFCLFLIPVLVLSLPGYLKGMWLKIKEISDNNGMTVKTIPKHSIKNTVVHSILIVLSTALSFYGSVFLMINEDYLMGIGLILLGLLLSIIASKYIRVKIIGI